MLKDILTSLKQGEKINVGAFDVTIINGVPYISNVDSVKLKISYCLLWYRIRDYLKNKTIQEITCNRFATGSRLISEIIILGTHFDLISIDQMLEKVSALP